MDIQDFIIDQAKAIQNVYKTALAEGEKIGIRKASICALDTLRQRVNYHCHECRSDSYLVTIKKVEEELNNLTRG